ncbi:hypothetical protein [Acidithiobacillus sulfuriphilus]|jgi:hypothetical protein|uniref:Uncharacterized protein n=2 Tax=Acidithiobacillus sulfuriphilus TaxID=1867749 RepID=A0A3M8QYI1_9PROT|nr:hypothetical protein [Acidithiobacillus sulfuriphilus]RNF59974.1 hypothetical protein EC580_10035 [Acidithiobacillus sulfuriphilus]
MEHSLVMIHVRFANDGSVQEVGERPAAASPQAWFNHLSRNSHNSYEPLSGGRGVFRLDPAAVEQMQAAFPPVTT